MPGPNNRILSMSEQIIILSDIHIKEDNNELATNKIIAIKDIISKENCYIDKLYMVIVGDIAQSGKNNEYDEFLAACQLLAEEIGKSHPNLEVNFISAPGNHDVNYEINRDYCECLLGTMDLNYKSYGAFYKFFAERFRDYNIFNNQLCGVDVKNRSFWTQEFNIGKGHILKFNVINTAIYSGYGKDKGYLSYPIDDLQNAENKKGSELAIGLMHHPLDWFEKKVKEALTSEILPNIDILITGHEHSLDYHQNINDEYSYLAIETNAFDEGDKKGATGVVSLYLDWRDENALEASVYSYTWEQNKYGVGKLRDTKTIRLKDMNLGCELMDQFANDMDSLPQAITNAGNFNIRARDIFVYPNLEKKSKGFEGSFSINALELFKRGESSDKYIIYGESKSGKTMLARRMFLDLWKQGKIPVLVDCESERYQKLGNLIANAYECEYKTKQFDNYLSLPAEQRAVIVDNFNPNSGNAKSRFEDLLAISKQIDTIVIFIDNDYLINCTNSGKAFQDVEAEFDIYRIIELNRKGRHQLISNWVEIFSRDRALDHQSLLHQIIDTENEMSVLCRDSLVPRYPMYVLMFLGAMSTINTRGQYNVGTYGSLYELVIRQELSKVSSLPLQDILNFLSEFSHYIYIHNVSKYFSETDYTNFASSFDKKYDLNLKSQSIFKELVEKRIFVKSRDDNDSISFCHDYFYYYFIALYFDVNSGTKQVSDEMKSLCNNFYKKDQAHIWLFLTHISHKSVVVDTLVAYANSILTPMDEVRLDDDVNFVEKLRCKNYQLQFCDKDYDSLQNERFVSEDKAEMIRSEIESTPFEELSPNDPVVLIVQANKVIDYLGQLLRNFVASLDARQKQDILDAIIRLTLRTISFFIRGVFLAAPDFIIEYIRNHEELQDDVSREEAIKEYSTYLYCLLVFSSSSMISKTARVTAHKLLQPSYKKFFANAGNINAYIILNYLIQMYVKRNTDSFIPEDLLKTLKRDVYCWETIRMIVFQYLYMYVDDFAVKQSLCERYHIPYKRIVLKESKNK